MTFTSFFSSFELFFILNNRPQQHIHMNLSKNKFQVVRSMLAGICLLSLATSGASAQSSTEALQQEVQRLQKQLKATQQQLAATQQQQIEAEQALKSLATREEAVAEKESKLANAADLGPSKITPGDLIPSLEGLTIGGAIRANYAIGDYGGGTGGPSKDTEDGGDFSLDVFRVNVDYTRDQFVAKFEYRWYSGYNMLHTGWLGYNFESGDQVQVGVNRVPFGPGAYGISQSWFFDQHYYVGLADDMDLGVKYSGSRGDLSFDFAYYFTDEGSYGGDSKQSARYSYDAVDETGNGYEERNQFNARAIYAADLGEATVDLGLSLQYGMLESNGPQDDGDHYAVSFHPVFKLHNWALSTQLTYYEYDIDGYDLNGDGTTLENPNGDLIQFGAFDFPTAVASEAWIAGASLSYYYEINQVDWVDYVIPYVEYSSIMKEASGFNDSDLLTIGAAWGRGGWYIYTELAASNGNDFVGGENGYNNRFGDNPNDDWQSRFNINFGYYF